MSYYDESEVKSVFGDDIKIYKLNANEEFFDYISQYSDSLPIKRGFCRSIQLSKNKIELTKKQKEKVRYVLNLCQNKFKDNHIFLYETKILRKNNLLINYSY